MKKHLILCYSKTGNSRFMAEKLKKELSCDLESVRPVFNNTVLVFLFSLLKIPIGTNITAAKIKEYQEIIILGPIWGGLIIAPLRTLLNKCFKLSKPVHFAVTCETSEADKDSKYGYNHVLNSASALGGKLVKTTAAFSTTLIKGYEPKKDMAEKAKITEENYSEELKMRLQHFKKRVAGENVKTEQEP
jgi:flavodoxin